MTVLALIQSTALNVWTHSSVAVLVVQGVQTAMLVFSGYPGTVNWSLMS